MKAFVSLVVVALLLTLLPSDGRAVVHAQEEEPAEPAVEQESHSVFLPQFANGPTIFEETFDGSPSQPTPWQSDNWDITVTSRNVDTWYELEPMQAHHGADCSGPPNTHTVRSYEDAVYQCKDHMMTAINASGYGAIYLTPNQLVDIGHETIIRFDVSTFRSSPRDWWDLWVVPYEDNVAVPLEGSLPALSGRPQRGIHITMDEFHDGTMFRGYRIDDYKPTDLNSKWWVTYESFLHADKRHRSTFELRISQTRVRFGMPEYGFWWVDTEIEPLDWDLGVVTLGHHSYNPTKCAGCTPNTWHWDNFSISPVEPFTIIHADRRFAQAGSDSLSFATPAPEGAHLRFIGIGENMEVSFDQGASWQSANMQRQERYDNGHFRSYWMPIPTGAKAVRFRGGPWWGGDWYTTSASLWAR